MVADLADIFATHLNLAEIDKLDHDMDVDSGSETSESEIDVTMEVSASSHLRARYDGVMTLIPAAFSKHQKIRFQGRQTNRVGVPMRVLVDHVLPVSLLRDGDESVAIFEESKYDRILFRIRWIGCDEDSKMIPIRDGMGEPINLRTLAEDVAQFCLDCMRQRSGVNDSEYPTIGNVTFYQLYLVGLYSTDGSEWDVEIQR
ncbi:hypothetical protein EVJ58_g1020 [Rhodofomes roseus]|uniref:Uncharacterized protein n=1 Tax=Rhodofomes roseus TaxID=34475 RepID=A0A4Y9Z3J1_9APHY|nr:hypothetical protein EVJ58_g1020 [Rhodofomes roseus]